LTVELETPAKTVIWDPKDRRVHPVRTEHPAKKDQRVALVLQDHPALTEKLEDQDPQALTDPLDRVAVAIIARHRVQLLDIKLFIISC